MLLGALSLTLYRTGILVLFFVPFVPGRIELPTSAYQTLILPLNYRTIPLLKMRREGFEPPVQYTLDFKSSAFGHSATAPKNIK